MICLAAGARSARTASGSDRDAVAQQLKTQVRTELAKARFTLAGNDLAELDTLLDTGTRSLFDQAEDPPAEQLKQLESAALRLVRAMTLSGNEFVKLARSRAAVASSSLSSRAADARMRARPSPQPIEPTPIAIAGCLQSGPVERRTRRAAGSAMPFVLTNAVPVDLDIGETDIDLLSVGSYRVVGETAALERRVGEYVEITGHLSRRASAGPALRVASLATLASQCPQDVLQKSTQVKARAAGTAQPVTPAATSGRAEQAGDGGTSSSRVRPQSPAMKLEGWTPTLPGSIFRQTLGAFCPAYPLC